MTVHVKSRMTVDQYLAWAAGQSGRFELHRGEVVAMPAQTANHARTKYAVHKALEAAIKKGRSSCHFFPDGMTVRIDHETAYEPDAVVYCGDEVPGPALEVPEPVIVVEVLSPSTQHVDLSQKLAGYFRVPSVLHYLAIDPSQPTVVHYARGTDANILTRVLTEGSIALDPPGIELALSDIYPA
jgi:Uma2 family endonuclease